MTSNNKLTNYAWCSEQFSMWGSVELRTCIPPPHVLKKTNVLFSKKIFKICTTWPS